MWYKWALRSLVALLGIVAVAAAADWDRTFDYLGDDEGKDSAVATTVDPEGNIYVLATCTNDDEVDPNLDVVVLKYSQTGDLVNTWSCDLGGDEEAVAFVRDELNRCLYVAALASSTYLIIKFEDGDSDTAWTRLLDTPASSEGEPVGIALGPQGAWVVLTGTITGGDLDWDEFYTVSYDFAGDFRWAEAYNYDDNGVEPDNVAAAIAVDAYGNTWVTGSTYHHCSGGNPDYELDFCTFFYNSSGVRQWVGVSGVIRGT